MPRRSSRKLCTATPSPPSGDPAPLGRAGPQPARPGDRDAGSGGPLLASARVALKAEGRLLLAGEGLHIDLVGPVPLGRIRRQPKIPSLRHPPRGRPPALELLRRRVAVVLDD